MARKTTAASFRDLVAAARQIMPDAAITTDVIAGFPGETDEEFAESLDFIQEMNFAGGHAFTYSPRPGTAAMRLAGQIRPEVRKERNAILRDVFEDGAKAYRQQFPRAENVRLMGIDDAVEWSGLANEWADGQLSAGKSDRAATIVE